MRLKGGMRIGIQTDVQTYSPTDCRALEKYHTNCDVDEIGRFSPDNSDSESEDDDSVDQEDESWETESVMRMLDDVRRLEISCEN